MAATDLRGHIIRPILIKSPLHNRSLLLLLHSRSILLPPLLVHDFDLYGSGCSCCSYRVSLLDGAQVARTVQAADVAGCGVDVLGRGLLL